MIPVFLLLAILFSYFCATFIKKFRNVLYLIAVLLDIYTVYMVWSEKAWDLPDHLSYLLGGLIGGIFGVSLIIIVMFLGVMGKDNAFRKRVMPIRAELSILGSLLILGHNISFGKGVIKEISIGLYTNAPLYNLAILTSTVLIILMLILLVTSFPAVRAKMDPRRWKKVQRLAYPFFILIYVHFVLIYVPWLAPEFYWYNLVSTICYTVIFVLYAYLKLAKEKSKALGSLAVLALLIFSVLVGTLGNKSTNQFYDTRKVEGVHARVTDVKLQGSYSDGKFVGKGHGKAGELEVEIEIKDNRIIAIDVLEHAEEEDPEIHWAINSVFPAIIETQSLDVEGAEASAITNEGLIEGVKAALEQAK